MDYGIINELQRMRPGESLCLDEGISVRDLDYVMALFMFNPTLSGVNVLRKLGQDKFKRGEYGCNYHYDVFLLYCYGSTEVVGYALRFFGGLFPTATYSNTEWLAGFAVQDTLDLVGKFLPTVLRKSGAVRSCEYYWGDALNSKLASNRLTLDFKSNAKEHLVFSEFITKYPDIQNAQSLDLLPTDKVLIKVQEVAFTGYAAECTYELSGNTFPTVTGVLSIQLMIPLREAIITQINELVNVVAKRTLGDAEMPKLEIRAEPMGYNPPINLTTTVNDAVAALVWRANPNHSLQETVDNVSNMVNYMPFISVACALEKRAPCSDMNVSDYHAMFNVVGLPDWVVIAYHQLELVLLQSPKVTTNLIIDTGGKSVTVRSNPTIPSNF
jgi:hypothetical protein